MLELYKKNLFRYANVRYEMESFETWAWSGAPFDLIISGTAFHWVAETGHRQLTDILRPNGSAPLLAYQTP